MAASKRVLLAIKNLETIPVSRFFLCLSYPLLYPPRYDENGAPFDLFWHKGSGFRSCSLICRIERSVQEDFASCFTAASRMARHWDCVYPDAPLHSSCRIYQASRFSRASILCDWERTTAFKKSSSSSSPSVLLFGVIVCRIVCCPSASNLRLGMIVFSIITCMSCTAPCRASFAISVMRVFMRCSES